MNTLRKITKLFVYILAICSAPFMFSFWICFWAPFWAVAISFMNVIEFANGTDDFLDYNIIWWAFWVFVMWNFEKADEYC